MKKFILEFKRKLDNKWKVETIDNFAIIFNKTQIDWYLKYSEDIDPDTWDNKVCSYMKYKLKYASKVHGEIAFNKTYLYVQYKKDQKKLISARKTAGQRKI